MVKPSEFNQNRQNRDVDAYLDAFVSQGSHSNAADKPLEQTVQSKVAVPSETLRKNEVEYRSEELPMAASTVQQFRNFAVANEQVQQLRKFLGDEPKIAPVQKSTNPFSAGDWLTNRLGLVKSSLVILSLAIAAAGLHRYYTNCNSTNTCSWISTLSMTAVDRKIANQQMPFRNPTPAAIEATNTRVTSAENPFRDAVVQAMKAVDLAQKAQTRDEWRAIIDTWLQAVKFMNAVPKSHPKYDLAQQKVKEYIGYLNYAEQRAADLAATQDTELQSSRNSACNSSQ